ncbi:hypothetical protein [Propionivibrio sp.]|uniref:hypothetical protein n=1 Tax=Propionivibrio sp. TaxID=2212460 RepID=UPI0025EAA9CB|nr:hypothetical protein [Propionivibrio sp.]MBK7357594.1 hypothetical protein [Propionivibrio sp.]
MFPAAANTRAIDQIVEGAASIRWPDELLRRVVQIKGYRREDAKEEKSTTDTHRAAGVNLLGTYGRWAFAEFASVFQMQEKLEEKVETELAKMIDGVVGK